VAAVRALEAGEPGREIAAAVELFDHRDGIDAQRAAETPVAAFIAALEFPPMRGGRFSRGARCGGGADGRWRAPSPAIWEVTWHSHDRSEWFPVLSQIVHPLAFQSTVTAKFGKPLFAAVLTPKNANGHPDPSRKCLVFVRAERMRCVR
jgi:hypothetical protein